MILDIIAFRNKKIKSYLNPQYIEGKLENLETSLARGIALGGPEAVTKYKNLALYHFGTFDDQLGKYQLFDEPELICDCDDIIASVTQEA